MKKYVYEFTNKRKVTKSEFLKWFSKKALYTIRKFEMIKKGDVIGYEKKNDFRSVVLEDVLKMVGDKGYVEVVEIRSLKTRGIDNSATGFAKSLRGKSVNAKSKLRGESDRVDKVATASTIDLEADKFAHEIISGKIVGLNELKPVDDKKKSGMKRGKVKVIKPLYLFLDKEVLLYAKLKGLKFKKVKKGEEERKDKISLFIEEMEKKHPEVKRSIVNSYLGLYC